MPELSTLVREMAWPLAILIAWMAGEVAFRWVRLSRISIYGLTGFLLAGPQFGLLPSSLEPEIFLLAHIAFGLILFEAGYRFNLRWLRTNPWLGLTCLAEASLTFGAVYLLAIAFDTAHLTALLLASISMATSPATVLRVINEQCGSGQVSERLIHLAVLNSVFAIIVFKVVVGLLVFHTSENIWDATSTSLLLLLLSALTGIIFGLLIPILLRWLGRATHDATLAFAIAVIALVALAHALKLSPVLATLTFGLTARHRRIVMSQTQRNFGPLGDLLAVFLFVFIAATLEWDVVVAGLGFGLLLVLTRALAKLTGVLLFANLSGISLYKGLLLGIALGPFAAFVILVLEQTRYLGINLFDQLAPLAAAALVMEILGPLLTQGTLVLAHEVQIRRGD
ncbi:Transporter, CPA2 family [Pseudomonas sp. 8AS]|uniref:cation:proton antiporter n=1 Tax=Pseudomonas sp. 8AS TaxID=2653163 RepID=UPI0012F3FFCD|nr:cation:proton antiporter [Pseudomonas sp. 8AS]VXC48259.1 Transporter, CPA2 family [Pseudomonas sp. 8AS]